MSTPTAPLHLACLCAAWCRLCDAYAEVFDAAFAALQADWPSLQRHWIDIEDESVRVGDLDVETFPFIVLADAQQVLFAGVLTPQPEVLLRVLRAALQAAQRGERAPEQLAEVLDFAQRLRLRCPD